MARKAEERLEQIERVRRLVQASGLTPWEKERLLTRLADLDRQVDEIARIASHVR